jgi:hypothetical protein
MCAITNEPATTYPLSDDFLSELGAAVRKDSVAAVQRSFWVDIALGDERIAVGGQAIFMDGSLSNANLVTFSATSNLITLVFASAAVPPKTEMGIAAPLTITASKAIKPTILIFGFISLSFFLLRNPALSCTGQSLESVGT